jgi:hypothetical protein
MARREPALTEADSEEFRLYLEACTGPQVYSVLAREREAHRLQYAALTKAELRRRGADIP